MFYYKVLSGDQPIKEATGVCFFNTIHESTFTEYMPADHDSCVVSECDNTKLFIAIQYQIHACVIELIENQIPPIKQQTNGKAYRPERRNQSSYRCQKKLSTSTTESSQPVPHNRDVYWGHT